MICDRNWVSSRQPDDLPAFYREVLALHPGDTLSQTYVERCEYLKAHPVNGEWDGVWRMTGK